MKVAATDERVCLLAVKTIAEHEGFRAGAYRCPAGVLTIGYGRTEGVREGDRTTEEAERLWLRARVRRVAAELDRASGHRELPVECWAALISWVYNVGVPAALRSTAWRALMENRLDRVDDELLRWVWHHDPVTGERVRSPGLLRRRRAEAALWNAGLAEMEPPDDAAELSEPLGRVRVEPEPVPVLRTDTMRGGGTAAVVASLGSVTPLLAGLDESVALVIVAVVVVASLIGLWFWRSRRE